MSLLSALKNSTTLHDLAALLEFKPSSLAYILYVKTDGAKYKTFDIPKRSGGSRAIAAPAPELKLLQRRLADLLQNCLDEINENNNRSDKHRIPDHIAHGFKRGRSIITNAREHRNRRYVFNVDLENFFGSINFGRVRGYFIKDKNFSLHPKVATILAKIACFEGSLPQGSPCSPIISNLIGHILDIHLVNLASRMGCTYSRYADDLTFSTNKRDFPCSIARRDEAGAHGWVPGSQVARLVTKCGFAINAKKTRMQYCNSRQEVTGLVVNRKINIRREYRHTVRAMVHRLFSTGSFDFQKTVLDASGNAVLRRMNGRLKQLHGMLGFVDGVDLFNRALVLKEKGASHQSSKDLSAKENMYRHFLLFKEFYATEMPVLVCEGKTDNVYITHAIRSLASLYPKLAQIDEEGKIAIKIRRFKYSTTSTGRILGLSGGVADLKGFITTYRRELPRFKAPGMYHPIILVIDNDKGAGAVYNVIKDITKATPTGAESFIHIVGNLYVVATPLGAGVKESKIEDLFDATTKATLLNGKTFDSSNGYNNTIHYGKADFAYKVVKSHADKIDFSGFKPLLERFSEVIDEHAKRHPLDMKSLGITATPVPEETAEQI